jgi:hypothetical protein
MAVKVEHFVQSFTAAKKGLEPDRPRPISS